MWVEPIRRFVFLNFCVCLCVQYVSGCGYNMCVYMHYYCKSNQRNLLLSDIIIAVIRCPNA